MYLGNTTLSKIFVLLDLQNQYCKSCNSSECTHCLAYEQCTCLITFETVNANFTKNMACYKVDTVHTILVDNCIGELHIYRLQENKFVCEFCDKACKAKSIINCLPEHTFRIVNEFNRKIESTSISSTHIPFTLSTFNQKFIIINYYTVCYFQMIYIQKTPKVP